MTLLLDSSLWIDFTRARSPLALKQFIAPLPSLPTPPDLWQQAIALGQACRAIGRTVLSLDLLVAAAAWLNALSTPPSLIGSPCCLP
jgi:hypothetical protein